MNKFLDDVTKFIFYEDELKKSDIILIPGSPWADIPEKAASLYLQGYANKILVSGKYSSKRSCFPTERINKKEYQGNYLTESEYISTVLIKNNVPKDIIIEENESSNSLENALFSKRKLDLENETIKSAIVCCQAFHARRAQLTYSLVFKEVDIYICPIVTQNISSDNWYKTKYGISRVLGEVERCGKYFVDDISNILKAE